MPPASEHRRRTFVFERDTFSFANELVWQYRFDPATGTMTSFRSDTPPAYSHRCFVLVRSARQFLFHARFDPSLPPADAAACGKLIREVVSRSPRHASAEAEQVVIPGYDGLRSFSRACEPLVKEGCGGPWVSYLMRSHWRMVWPIWRGHQERMAGQLRQGVREGRAPTVHLFRFPDITINHGIILFGLAESNRGIRFDAYDPNIPDRPVQLHYERGLRQFWFPNTHYFAGGGVNVVEIFRGGLY